MKKNRIAYALLLAFCIFLLIFYSSTLFLYMIVFLLGMAALMGGFLFFDKSHLKAELLLIPGTADSENMKVQFKLDCSSALHSARFIQVVFVVENRMFGVAKKRTELLELTDRETVFELEQSVELCGEVRVCCEEIVVYDVLRLFGAKLAPAEAKQTIVYPKKINVQIETSNVLYGNNNEDGRIQNRRGKDKSEIYDMREYMQGDDLRSIHWKLYGKTGKLLIREASDPTHYQIAILPDFGLMQDKTPVLKKELSAAAAMTVAIGEELLSMGICFGFFMPSERGLLLKEIKNKQEFEHVLSEWLGIRIQQRSGVGLRYFQLNHMEQYCSRLVIIGTGGYTPAVSDFGSTIGVTQINMVSGAEEIVTDEEKGYGWIEIPAELSGKQTCHIVC